jgi:hypothetical protein
MLAQNSSVSKAVIRTPKYFLWDFLLNPWVLGVCYTTNVGMLVGYNSIFTRNPRRVNNVFLTLEDFGKHRKYYKTQFFVLTLAGYYYQHRHGRQFIISMTFCNGFANNYKYVLAALEKSQVATNVFKAVADAWHGRLPAFYCNKSANQYVGCVRERFMVSPFISPKKPTVC